MSKIEPEAWKHGTDCQHSEGEGEEEDGGKQGNRLVKEHV